MLNADNHTLRQYPTDPGHRNVVTSVAAAVQMKLSAKELRYRILELLRGEMKLTGATTEELCKRLGQKEKHLQPRTSELQKQKMIQDSGATRLNEDGNPCIVWEAA